MSKTKKIYDEKNELVNMICISNTGNISVNDHTYRLSNASELVEKILEILE